MEWLDQNKLELTNNCEEECCIIACTGNSNEVWVFDAHLLQLTHKHISVGTTLAAEGIMHKNITS